MQTINKQNIFCEQNKGQRYKTWKTKGKVTFLTMSCLFILEPELWRGHRFVLVKALMYYSCLVLFSINVTGIGASATCVCPFDMNICERTTCSWRETHYVNDIMPASFLVPAETEFTRSKMVFLLHLGTFHDKCRIIWYSTVHIATWLFCNSIWL